MMPSCDFGQDELQLRCVDRLYCGLSPDIARGTICVILNAVVDDSQNDDFYLVAGFVASLDQWAPFPPNWYEVLKRPPKLGFYRTSDSLALKKDFQHFDKKMRDERVVALARTIPSGVGCFGIRCTVPKTDFHELYSPNFHPAWKDPYYLCAIILIQRLCIDLSVVPGLQKIDFIFDEQGKVGARFEGMYDRLIKPLSLPLFPFLGKVRHEDKKIFLPLQAADMQAGWVRRLSSLIQAETSADVYLKQIEQRDYSITRARLEHLADYANAHAEEMKAFAEMFEQNFK